MCVCVCVCLCACMCDCEERVGREERREGGKKGGRERVAAPPPSLKPQLSPTHSMERIWSWYPPSRISDTAMMSPHTSCVL